VPEASSANSPSSESTASACTTANSATGASSSDPVSSRPPAKYLHAEIEALRHTVANPRPATRACSTTGRAPPASAGLCRLGHRGDGGCSRPYGSYPLHPALRTAQHPRNRSIRVAARLIRTADYLGCFAGRPPFRHPVVGDIPRELDDLHSVPYRGPSISLHTGNGSVEP